MASSALNMAYGTHCGRVVRGKEKKQKLKNIPNLPDVQNT